MSATSDLEIVDDEHGFVVRRVVVGPLDTNCWILRSTTSSDAFVIDPGDEPSRIIDAASDLEVSAIVLTHSHWDHVLALPEVADKWGCDVLMHPDDAPVWPHELDHLSRFGHFDAGTATQQLLACGCSLSSPIGVSPWAGTTRPLHHGERLPLSSNQTAQVIHTPGHTPGGISVVVGNIVFSGDTLFPGGPGLTGWPCQTSPPSSTQSGTDCSRCPATPSCTPATATPPRSAPNNPTSRNGSHAVGEHSPQINMRMPPEPRSRPHARARGTAPNLHHSNE